MSDDLKIKKLTKLLHDISIHINFHQNQSMNECARIIRWSYMTIIFSLNVS